VAPSGQLRVSRYFAVLLAIVAALWALVLFTGDREPIPRLGLDLQGGTTMTLSATTPDGSAPDQQQLEQARDIITNRVNGTGVTEAEVITQGDRNIIVNVPGSNEEALRQIGAPAELRFREVQQSTQDSPEPVERPSESPSASTDPSADPSASVTPDPSAGATPSSSDAAVSDPNASATPDPNTSETPDPSASASTEPTPSASASASPNASLSPCPTNTPSSSEESPDASSAPCVPAELPTLEEVLDKLGPELTNYYYAIDSGQLSVELIGADAYEREEILGPFRELSGAEVAVLSPTVQFAVPQITCAQLNQRPPGSIQDPEAIVVACSEDNDDDPTTVAVKYLLSPAEVLGTHIESADFTFDTTGRGWTVVMEFDDEGTRLWRDLTSENVGEQVAVVLDNVVVSAPEIEEAMPAGQASITGSFSRDEARTLAAQLRYGSLPLTFNVETLTEISPTLGLDQMQAGLLAGAVGVGLVILYCFFYYRVLGVVVVASLVVSASIIYPLLVLLGRQIDFTLTLAGIAGFIVAIGITADSFVVFFERLKDEVKEGRSVRAAVPRAWVRARRTIISANGVSFIGAIVLYFLAIGAVRGFAFTLGMSTVIDLLIVFLFTHPLVALMSRWRVVTHPRVSGLGNLRPDPRSSTPSGGRGIRVKES